MIADRDVDTAFIRWKGDNPLGNHQLEAFRAGWAAGVASAAADFSANRLGAAGSPFLSTRLQDEIGRNRDEKGGRKP